jgi:subtilisin family serine protease
MPRGPRKRPRGGGGGKIVFPNYQHHGEEIAKQFANISALHIRRRQEAGVDPRLVMVIRLNRTVDPEDFKRAGIRVLDDSSGRSVIAFTDDPHLTEFQRRLAEYEAGPGPEQKNPSHQGLMDAVEAGAEYLADDKVTRRLRERLDGIGAGTRLLLDIECWHPGDAAAAEEWRNEVRALVVKIGGAVLDAYLSNNSLLSLLRVRVPANQVITIAEMSSVARIDALPEPQLSTQDIFNATTDDLPTVVAPPDDAPIVGVIDSGVRDAHPLLAPAIRQVVTLTASLGDGRDRDGHGTAVTSLVLHGPLEELLITKAAATPVGWIISVRVLDDEHQFPEEELWEKMLANAVEYCADHGARVVNLSVGSAFTPYRGAKATPVAALLDDIARRRGVVLVISTGNVPPIAYLDRVDADTPQSYIDALAISDDSRIIDPAPSALALTVGAVCHDPIIGALGRQIVEQRPLGQADWPAPFTRRGPGVNDSVKPELIAPGGTLAYDDATHSLTRVPALELVVASAKPDRLLGLDCGTSYAAPLVTRVVAGVAHKHPGASANLLRALTLQSALETPFWRDLGSATEYERRRRARSVQGHGRARFEEARSSTNHRVVMYGTASIRANDVHLWQIPVPAGFMQSGAERELVVALAFDPPTRGRRLDYLASTMQFEVVRGLAPDVIDGIYRAATEEQLEEATELDESEAEDAQAPKSVANLGRHRIHLEPNANERRGSANQLARWRFRKRLNEKDGDTYHLMVRNVASWANDDDLQDYAIALAWVEDSSKDPIYVQLEARLRIPIELQIEPSG